jgi:hypothetical protein
MLRNEYDNMDALIGDLTKMLDQIETDPFTSAFEECKQHVGQGIDSIFYAAMDSMGSEWAPHAPSTIARYGIHPLLELTGVLKASVVGQGAGHIEMIEDRTLTWGTSVEYAIYLQMGTVNMPQREFLWLPPFTIEKCAETIANYVNTQIIG